MRIKFVDVNNWRILKRPELESDTPLTVIVGENGSGKSSLLELILYIFNEVYLRLEEKRHKPVIDGFLLQYEKEIPDGKICDVEIESGYEEGGKAGELLIKVNEEMVAIDENKKWIRSLLPSNILVYYAGETRRMKDICEYYLETRQKDVIKSGNNYSISKKNLPESRPFIYSDMAHLPVSLIALMVSRQKSQTIEKLNIDEASVEIEINLQRPQWASHDNGGVLGNGSSLLEEFLQGLMQHAVEVVVPNRNGLDIKTDVNGIRDFLDDMKIGKQGVFLFEMFDLLQYNGFVNKIDVLWNKCGDYHFDTPVSIDYFSEGEKQVILTAAMTEFWDVEHCIFLYDEPDTFLHPRWQKRFLPELLQNLHKSHAIVTTHSPLMVSTITDEGELFLMHDGELDYFDRSTYGMDASEVIGQAMDTAPRDDKIAELMVEIEKDIDDRRYDEATQKVEVLKKSGVSQFEINRFRSIIDRVKLVGV